MAEDTLRDVSQTLGGRGGGSGGTPTGMEWGFNNPTVSLLLTPINRNII